MYDFVSAYVTNLVSEKEIEAQRIMMEAYQTGGTRTRVTRSGAAPAAKSKRSSSSEKSKKATKKKKKDESSDEDDEDDEKEVRIILYDY